MKNLVFLTITFLVSSFFSCRKDSPVVDPPITNPPDMLTGDTSILVGTWKWQYTEHIFNWCYGPTLYEVLDSASEMASYKMNVKSNGYVEFYMNDNLQVTHGIFIEYFGTSGCQNFNTNFLYSINLNDTSEIAFNACVGQDWLVVTSGFPFDNYEIGCEDYISFFQRE